MGTGASRTASTGLRDVTFDEDRSQVRTGAAPQVLAGLRNLVISLVRRAGHSNVAAALRRHNAHLSEAFDMMGFTYQAGPFHSPAW